MFLRYRIFLQPNGLHVILKFVNLPGARLDLMVSIEKITTFPFLVMQELTIFIYIERVILEEVAAHECSDPTFELFSLLTVLGIFR